VILTSTEPNIFRDAVFHQKSKIYDVVMPYPCSHFYFDINFGNKLYPKEKRPGSPLLFSFEYNLFQILSHHSKMPKDG
jgi:hypothetical protein